MDQCTGNACMNKIGQFRYIFDILNSVQYNRPQHEALGNKLHKLCSYSKGPCAEVYCFRLNFNISKLALKVFLIPLTCT